ncbi:EamA family transporter [Paracidovorax sp. MALMAid1276]|uniref:EamA family transporter n=1 Tax=Paracidovorax sp. MALMAid1276 TaxID=3411631 RepID=UPI003B9C91DA
MTASSASSASCSASSDVAAASAASPVSPAWHSLVPFLAVLGSVTALGIGTSWAKHWLFPAVGAQGTTALRVGLSAVLVLLLWRPWRWRLSRVDAKSVVLYGAALGGMNLMFYMSLRTLPFGLAVAIEFAGPLAVAIASSRRAVDFVWVLLAIAGLGLLLPLGLNGSMLDPAGVAYALGAAVFWALYIVFGKRAGHLHAGHSVSLGLLVAALVVVPVGVAHAGVAALLSPSLLLIGLAVAAVSSAVPISLEMMALKRLPKEAFGIMISMEPAVAALVAMALLGEHLSATQWLAIGCIMAASMGSAATARAPAARRAEAAPA